SKQNILFIYLLLSSIQQVASLSPVTSILSCFLHHFREWRCDPQLSYHFVYPNLRGKKQIPDMGSSAENGAPPFHVTSAFEIGKPGEEEVNDSPIEQVRLTVPITDDPSQPTITIRTWVLGILSCSLLAFVNQFFGYRSNQLYVSSVAAQIVVLPLGKLMAAVIPSIVIRVPLTKWSFSLNPGPFNLKEHVLITIFANCGAGGVYAVAIITAVRAFYHRGIHPAAAMLLVQTTQLLGYGWAGMFRKYLVDSPYMWWPSNLVQVSLFRALHEKENRARGGQTRLQFFTIVFICSFAYYVVPSYLFPSLSTLSFICWIWKDSITAQQIGSGLRGLGVGSFGLDWSTVAGFLGSPLATPLFAIINTLAGFFMVVYVIIPIAYWNNAFEAKRFPIFSQHTFDSGGQIYNITRVLNDKSFGIDHTAYQNYSRLYLSVTFAFVYGMSFAALMATISHVVLFDGKEMWKKTTSAMKDQYTDVHTRLMKKNYEAVPQWWFMTILVISLALAFLAVEGFNKQLQLPWWGLLLACGIALFFTLPIGIIQATTNQQMGLNVITELIIGYIYPGRPLANVAFKTYGYISMAQALGFLQDFKLGHYMKIPPKVMFLVQTVGTIVASTVYFATSWWLLSDIKNICKSPWTCPGDDVFYSASIIWGVIGPLRMFTDSGNYPQMNWFFLVGLLAPVPVWLLWRKYPEKKWIRLIHMPLIFAATANMPPAKPVHYLSWGTVGILFNYYIYRKYKGWWARHTYILSAAMDAGVAFLGILIYFTLQSKDIYGAEWWGLQADDHCPLASCPTASGIQVDGCPLIQ
ncbi:Oligopeptide transporter 5, partial [Linum perenne]